MKTILFAAALMLSAFAAGAQNRSLVFDKGEGGSKFYRIPAIEVNGDGSLVAVADRRWENNGDLPGRIDVVAKRSTDKGATWGPMITVMENNEAGGYGDPALLRDARTGDLICVATHGAGLFPTDSVGAGSRIVISRSTDGGQTWGAIQDITDQIFPYDTWSTSFATSGRGLQLNDGRLMFVLEARPDGSKPWSPLHSYAVFSDDGGRTWRRGKTPATENGDESKLVQLPGKNGKVMMSVRHRGGGGRLFAVSPDRGDTWGEVFEAETLPDQGCNGDILLLEGKTSTPVLIHSLPAHPQKREQVSFNVSDDNGKTWRRTHTVCPTGSAYSSFVRVDEDTLGILTEEDASDGGFRLWFTQVPIAEVLAE